MSSKIKVGDVVRFKSGRICFVGSVIDVKGGTVEVVSDNGARWFCFISQCEVLNGFEQK